MPELRFTCALEHGLHARPASVLAEALQPFSASVELIRESTGRSADVRSVLSMVALDVARGDACVIRAEGEDADGAVEALRELISEGFAEAAAASQEQATLAAHAEMVIPAGLQRLGARWIAGRSISLGFARAAVAIVQPLQSIDERRAAASPQQERAAAHRALHEVRQLIVSRLDAATEALQRDLLRAHLGIADDPALREKIDEAIDAGASAASSLRRAGEFFVRTLKAAASEYVRDRAIDVEDVCQQVLERLGADDSLASIALRRPSIIVADLLTPRQMMQLDRALVRGLVLGRVGATSHTAILARTFGIPAITEVDDGATLFEEGREIIVDANGGFVLPEVTQDVRRYYAIEQRMRERRRERLTPFLELKATTRDGVQLEIAANVSTPDEVAIAMGGGAEGIGLFRTEMLYLDRAAPPDEEEQFAAYSRAVETAKGLTVIIRTLDIGGDKPAPYLRLPREENPVLGYRGIRLYDQFADLLRTQLRAIARASAKGPIKVMAPMVNTARQAKQFLDLVREVQAQLSHEGIAFDPSMPIGVMIEVPAAALAIDHLAEVVDFFSVGTNDLAQYFMAVDRGNSRVAELCDPLEPAFLRVLMTIAQAARRHKRWIGVCGEMAGEPLHLPLMLGLAVDEISVAASRVLGLKAALAGLDSKACRALLEQAAACRDAGDVRTLLGGAFGSTEAEALLDQSMVVIDSDAENKVEAIKELCGLIIAAGRAADGVALENAVWAREDTYATGMGHGFAIPHCKSAAVRAPTIAVAKYLQHIDWGSSDSKPVRMAIMLAIPDTPGEAVSADAARKHMQVLAQLARKLMHQDFRARLMNASNAEAVVNVIASGFDEPGVGPTGA